MTEFLSESKLIDVLVTAGDRGQFQRRLLAASGEIQAVFMLL